MARFDSWRGGYNSSSTALPAACPSCRGFEGRALRWYFNSQNPGAPLPGSGCNSRSPLEVTDAAAQAQAAGRLPGTEEMEGAIPSGGSCAERTVLGESHKLTFAGATPASATTPVSSSGQDTRP